MRASTRLPSALGIADPSRPPPPISLSLLKGYLLLSTLRHLAVYNVSDGLSRRPPRLVLTQDLASLVQEFLQPPDSPSPSSPSIAAGVLSSASPAAQGAPPSKGAALGVQGGSGEGAAVPAAGAEDSSTGPASGRGRELLGAAAGSSTTEASGAQACQAGGSSSGGTAEGACISPEAAGQACTAGGEPPGSSSSSSSGSSGGGSSGGGYAGGAEGLEGHIPGTAAALLPASRRPAQAYPQQRLPLVATDGGELVALGLGGGVLALYESRMPQRAKPPPPAGTALLQVRCAALCCAALALLRPRRSTGVLISRVHRSLVHWFSCWAVPCLGCPAQPCTEVLGPKLQAFVLEPTELATAHPHLAFHELPTFGLATVCSTLL